MPLPDTHPYYKFPPAQISSTQPVPTVTATLAISTLTATWTTSLDADSYTVELYSSATSGGTYTLVSSQTIGLGILTTTFTLSATNYYKVYVTAVGRSGGVSTPTMSSYVLFTVAAWSPTTALSGATLITWFDGNTGLSTSSWTNRGTNGGSATVVSTGGVALTTVNSLPAITFSNAGGKSYASFTQTATQAGRSAFVVVRFNTAVTAQQFLIGYDNFSAHFDFQLTYSSPNITLVQLAQGVAVYVQSINIRSTTLVSGTPYMLGIVNSGISAGSNSSWINNTSYALGYSAVSGGYAGGAQTLWLGGWQPAALSNSSCTFCEVLVYDGEVAAADVANIYNYLKRWGLP